MTNIAELCNGSTTDSDSVCWGSNPYSAAMQKTVVPNGTAVLFMCDLFSLIQQSVCFLQFQNAHDGFIDPFFGDFSLMDGF